MLRLPLVLTASALFATSLCLPAAAPLHPAPILITVSPAGDDASSGAPGHPFRTLVRAQRAVRVLNSTNDVTVQLADGVYRLDHPLLFRALDGGRNAHHVTWTAAPNAHPVVSGATPITGWTLFDANRQIYVADTPRGLDSRQLWVGGHLAPLASSELARQDVTFTREGITLKPSAPNVFVGLEPATRLEVHATGFFTERVAPVQRVAGRTLFMRQPAWDNNLWGYDTIEKPFHPALAHLYLANALPLLTQPGQWFLDPVHGKLYLRPPAGVNISEIDVELPHLTALVSISGTLADPIHDLTFSGLRFSHTTWLGPSGPEGYASQQSGSFITGHAEAYPPDPIATCAQGCPAFESVRSGWSQMPAAIQVSAAFSITFRDCVFAHLGQYALGVGNDPDAALSRVGLATGDIDITANVFTDLAGGAILAGGVRPNAHHPADPRLINRSLIVRSNRIRSVSLDYADNAAILSTYITGAVILHNDISMVPYDAIDIGYGWGINDPGGNPNYRFRMHDAKRLFEDGGAIYNLSASPHSLITENYIFDNHGKIALYLDEGSRFLTVRRNIVQDPTGEWLNINTVHGAYPLRTSPDNTASGNWHDSSKTGGLWTNYQNDLIVDDHLILNDTWPPEAEAIMNDAGIEPVFGPVAYGDAQPDPH
jgi:hypothetical protein